ncbi:MAG: restriction endonuclease subunit S [Planctomycetota bacterium]
MSAPWPIVPLKEIADRADRAERPEPGQTYRQIGVRLWGEGAYEREPIDGAATKYSRLYRADAGDIIVNKIWARNGSVAVVPEELAGCLGSGEFPMFSPCRDRLEPQWFHWITKTRWFWQACDEHARGTSGKNRIRPDKFLEIRIPLPPLAEQRRIVAKIDQLAAKIAEARGLRERAIDAASVLLSSEVNETFAISRDGLPAHWRWVSVDELGPDHLDTVQTGPFGAQLHKRDYVPEGRPVLAIGNVQWGRLDLSQIDHVTEAKAGELCRYVLAEGDVLFTRSGTVGRSAVVPPEAHGWLMTGHILRIRLDRALVEPAYLFYGFRGSRQIRQQVEGAIRGATRAGFNTRLLSRVELPLAPLTEQRRIVAHFDDLQAKVDRLKELQAATAAELDALLPAILDKAFKGKL